MTTATEVKEQPIPFTGDMIWAIQHRRIGQTRRIAKGREKRGGVIVGPADEPFNAIESYGGGSWDFASHMECVRCPYGLPGDRLWVRETWRGPWECSRNRAMVQYRSDGEYLRKERWPESFRIKTDEGLNKWKSSILMPRWASRITLEITDVRVELLQDISEEDAIAEGVEALERPGFWRAYNCKEGFATTAKRSYETLWESIYGPGSWNENPWVWALTFRRIKP